MISLILKFAFILFLMASDFALGQKEYFDMDYSMPMQISKTPVFIPSFQSKTGSIMIKFKIRRLPKDFWGGFHFGMLGDNKPHFVATPISYPVSLKMQFYEIVFDWNQLWYIRHARGGDDRVGLVSRGPSTVFENDAADYWINYEYLAPGLPSVVTTGQGQQIGDSIIQTYKWPPELSYNVSYFGFYSEATEKRVTDLMWSDDGGVNWKRNAEFRLPSPGQINISKPMLGTYPWWSEGSLPSNTMLLKFELRCIDVAHIALSATASNQQAYQISLRSGSVTIARSVGGEKKWSDDDKTITSIASGKTCIKDYVPIWVTYDSQSGALVVGSGKVHSAPAFVLASTMWPSTHRYPFVSQFSFTNDVQPISVRNIRWSVDQGENYSVMNTQTNLA